MKIFIFKISLLLLFFFFGTINFVIYFIQIIIELFESYLTKICNFLEEKLERLDIE